MPLLLPFPFPFPFTLPGKSFRRSARGPVGGADAGTSAAGVPSSREKKEIKTPHGDTLSFSFGPVRSAEQADQTGAHACVLAVRVMGLTGIAFEACFVALRKARFSCRPRPRRRRLLPYLLPLPLPLTLTLALGSWPIWRDFWLCFRFRFCPGLWDPLRTLGRGCGRAHCPRCWRAPFSHCRLAARAGIVLLAPAPADIPISRGLPRTLLILLIVFLFLLLHLLCLCLCLGLGLVF